MKNHKKSGSSARTRSGVGAVLCLLAGACVAGHSVRQTTYSLGGRWGIHPRMALKMQWDRVNIRSNGSCLWANGTWGPCSANIATVLLGAGRRSTAVGPG